MQRSSETGVIEKRRLSKNEIYDILLAAQQGEEPVVLSVPSISTSFFCPIEELDDQELSIKNPIPPELAVKAVQSKTFQLYCRSYRLDASALVPRGQDLVFSIPEGASLSAARTDERIYFAPKDDAYVLIVHPYDKGTILKRRVFDMSSGGMSFRVRQITSFTKPGRILPKLEVFAKGKPITSKSGKIVYVTRIVDQSGESFHQVGVQFTAPPEKRN